MSFLSAFVVCLTTSLTLCGEFWLLSLRKTSETTRVVLPIPSSVCIVFSVCNVFCVCSVFNVCSARRVCVCVCVCWGVGGRKERQQKHTLWISTSLSSKVLIMCHLFLLCMFIYFCIVPWSLCVCFCIAHAHCVYLHIGRVHYVLFIFIYTTYSLCTVYFNGACTH